MMGEQRLPMATNAGPTFLCSALLQMKNSTFCPKDLQFEIEIPLSLDPSSLLIVGKSSNHEDYKLLLKFLKGRAVVHISAFQFIQRTNTAPSLCFRRSRLSPTQNSPVKKHPVRLWLCQITASSRGHETAPLDWSVS